MAVGMIRRVFDSVSLVSAANSTSASFRMDEGADWGLWIKQDNANGSLTASLLLSYDDVGDHFITPDGYSSITTSVIITSVARTNNIDRYNMMYGKIKVANTTSLTATVSAYIFNREDAF